MGMLVDLLTSQILEKIPKGMEDDDRHQVKFMLQKLSTQITTWYTFKATKMNPEQRVRFQ
jgi:hypothetical protein